MTTKTKRTLAIAAVVVLAIAVLAHYRASSLDGPDVGRLNLDLMERCVYLGGAPLVEWSGWRGYGVYRGCQWPTTAVTVSTQPVADTICGDGWTSYQPFVERFLEQRRADRLETLP